MAFHMFPSCSDNLTIFSPEIRIYIYFSHLLYRMQTGLPAASTATPLAVPVAVICVVSTVPALVASIIRIKRAPSGPAVTRLPRQTG